jgi:hypothetical protein
MDIASLKVELDKLKIKTSSYSLKGGLPSEKYCLSNQGSKWSVYYSERGEKTGENVFSNESKACEYFLNELKNDPTTRA